MVYFLSDLHLGAKYIPDTHQAERRVVAFLEMIKKDATDVYLMGDVLDYWFEYRTVVPRGYVRFLGALAQLADAGVKIHWYIGNHDIWLFDYLRDEIGMEVVDGYKVEMILGKKFFLSHGDGVGKLPLGFRFIRWMFRNKFLQKLYSGIHPRWTIPFAHAWSASSRDFDSYGAPKFEGLDREPQAIFAQEYLRDVDPTINYFIFGHRHVLAQEALSPTCELIILGDWITQFTYAEFDGSSLSLHHFTT
ncbi:MAG: UDP-2,3-diacylglucosamine diphosphatase [Bacteroidales bacterium]|nr:UDP-2,3-diacylglucosamine diphosphatase [Bacteroidales bacterium]